MPEVEPMHWPPEATETATSSPAPRQKHSPGGCTVDMPRRSAIGGEILFRGAIPCSVCEFATVGGWLDSVTRKTVKQLRRSGDKLNISPVT